MVWVLHLVIGGVLSFVLVVGALVAGVASGLVLGGLALLGLVIAWPLSVLIGRRLRDG